MGSPRRCDYRNESRLGRARRRDLGRHRREEEKKTMNGKSWACSVLGGGLLVCAGAARAQETIEAPPPVVMIQAGIPEDGGGPAGAFGERIELLGFSGMHGGKVVKGV